MYNIFLYGYKRERDESLWPYVTFWRTRNEFCTVWNSAR